MAIGLEVAVSNVLGVLSSIAPGIAVILITLGGITYGLAQMQPGESRGKWQTVAISMIVGGIIVAAVTFAADYLVQMSGNLLKPI
jgi:uncharacterized membrane protein